LGFLTKKREVDIVSVIAVAASASILSFFASWLYFSADISKMQESYEMKVGIFRSNSEQIMEKNSVLLKKIAKIKEIAQNDSSIIKIIEE
jgi:hypothetical protein